MKGRIIRIGNSRGVIIPSSLLKTLLPKGGSAVELSVEDGHLIIAPGKEEGFSGRRTGAKNDGACYILMEK